MMMIMMMTMMIKMIMTNEAGDNIKVKGTKT